jgi:hypothetical protein
MDHHFLLRLLQPEIVVPRIIDINAAHLFRFWFSGTACRTSSGKVALSNGTFPGKTTVFNRESNPGDKR